MGMKLYYKYEWDDHAKQFTIVKGESTHRTELSKEARKLVFLTIQDITKKSGLTSKVDLMLTLAFYMVAIPLFIASFFLLRYRIWIAGILFLAFTPFIAFSLYVVKVMRGRRYQRLMEYMDQSDLFYKEMLMPAHLDLSFYFFESSLDLYK